MIDPIATEVNSPRHAFIASEAGRVTQPPALKVGASDDDVELVELEDFVVGVIDG